MEKFEDQLKLSVDIGVPADHSNSEYFQQRLEGGTDLTAEPKAQNKQESFKKWRLPKTNMSKLYNTLPKKRSWYFLLFALIITALGLLIASFKKLNSTQYGLSYNVHKKQLADAVQSGGIHSGPPGFQFIKFPSTQITVDVDGICNSRDGLEVAFQVTYQYQIPKEWVKPVIERYRDFYKWATVVESAAVAALQHSCADYDILDFQQQRGIIQNTMEDRLRVRLEGPEKDGKTGVYAKAISLQLRNLDLPDKYTNAVSEKQAAAEDIQLAKNQRIQETTKANTRLLDALEQAKIILDTAENEANVTITEAQLKAQEIQYAFEKEALVLTTLKTDLNLTTDGLIAFWSLQLYEKAENLKVTAAEPARLSRKDEL